MRSRRLAKLKETQETAYEFSELKEKSKAVRDLVASGERTCLQGGVKRDCLWT
jgi:hypothetical protein